MILRINLKTVARKLHFLANQARLDQEAWLRSLPQGRISEVQFDDLETSEHSKCKPLSVPLVVDAKSRKILAFSVAQMPAKGLLARVARQKYGPRPDQRAQGWREVLEKAAPLCAPGVKITSDENPHYPNRVSRFLPGSLHVQVEGKRGCIAGQGELKKTGFDPLFSLNHTCAMLRANINRLFRRTWCTTKKRECLVAHLWIYLKLHNRVLTPEILI
jgi:hypothetical protein